MIDTMIAADLCIIFVDIRILDHVIVNNLLCFCLGFTFFTFRFLYMDSAAPFFNLLNHFFTTYFFVKGS